MNTHFMKLKALAKALDPEVERPEVFEENYNETWRLQCYCHGKVDFIFDLWRSDGRGDWRSHGTLSEKEAAAFLKGLGHSD